MVEAMPVRLRLSRAKGFNLQDASRAANGLECVKVSRPGKWGNPFFVLPNSEPGRSFGKAEWGNQTWAVPTAEDAVACYAEMMASDGDGAKERRAALHELRGKNLACWCGDGPCHADVLLELANASDVPRDPASVDMGGGDG